jgi:hypothetical protein
MNNYYVLHKEADLWIYLSDTMKTTIVWNIF